MPRFFFHTDDGSTWLSDAEGQDLPDAAAARAAAIDVLPDMARDKLPDGDHRVFRVAVEDEAGDVLYEAALELTGRWLKEPPPSS